MLDFENLTLNNILSQFAAFLYVLLTFAELILWCFNIRDDHVSTLQITDSKIRYVMYIKTCAYCYEF